MIRRKRRLARVRRMANYEQTAPPQLPESSAARPDDLKSEPPPDDPVEDLLEFTGCAGPSVPPTKAKAPALAPRPNARSPPPPVRRKSGVVASAASKQGGKTKKTTKVFIRSRSKPSIDMSKMTKMQEEIDALRDQLERESKEAEDRLDRMGQILRQSESAKQAAGLAQRHAEDMKAIVKQATAARATGLVLAHAGISALTCLQSDAEEAFYVKRGVRLVLLRDPIAFEKAGEGIEYWQEAKIVDPDTQRMRVGWVPLRVQGETLVGDFGVVG